MILTLLKDDEKKIGTNGIKRLQQKAVQCVCTAFLVHPSS